MPPARLLQAEPVASLPDPMHGLLTAIFRSIAAPVVVVRADGRILTANPAFTRLLGRPIGELVEQPFASILAGDGPVPAGEAVSSRGGQTQELCLLRADAAALRRAATSSAIDQPGLGQLAVITLREPPAATEQIDPAIRAIQQRLPRGVVVPAGRVQIVRLDEARATLGERWAAVSARMLRTAEHIIERRLGEREVFSRTQDGNFVICLTDAPDNEIRFRADAIEQEVLRALLGEDAPARAVRVETPEPDSPAPRALARVELEAAMECDGELRPLHPTDGAAPTLAWITPRPEPLRRINRALTALPPEDPDRLLPDTLALVLAVRAILADDQPAGPRPATIVTAIDYEAAASRRRMARITDACRTLPGAVRRQLLIMLTGVPRGVAPGRLVETVQTLRPLCRAVGVVVEDLAALPLAPLLHPGTLIGVAAADLLKAAALQDGTLDRIARQLHQHQAALLALGAAVPDELPRLRALGVDLASE